MECPHGVHMCGQGRTGRSARLDEELPAHAELDNERSRFAASRLPDDGELLPAALNLGDCATLEHVRGRDGGRWSAAAGALTRESAGRIAGGDEHIAPQETGGQYLGGEYAWKEGPADGLDLGEFGHTQA